MTNIKEEYERVLKAEENLEKTLLTGDMLFFNNSFLTILGDVYDNLVGYFSEKLSSLSY